ncbi:chromate transporter [Halalkalibacter sp. APA_J-10(15)]|uniref:chromate transporter n=1 Tax=Halalkalibacter sp. APA_J-10(15) TaxID=2933805 RepID=UPI001FF1CD58|nr:chromate transporter [Halalkalibacter sp. APA_J-10(15)]MCK0470957.1 chromate transporter [Halalkalibacter sp. APA_J-10(15)]
MQETKPKWRILLEIFLISTRLGLTSFGGPVAHLGYFHEEYVRRRKWMDEKSYADLVALCQFLPGPASSQVGMGIGLMRGGLIGGVISFIGFTFPSVVVLILFALVLLQYGALDAGWIQGLKIVAVVVVAHAILGMAKNLTPDVKRKTIAMAAVVIVLIWQAVFSQVVVILGAAVVGYLLYRNQKIDDSAAGRSFPITRRVGTFCLLLFVGLLISLPILRELTSSTLVAMIDSFYRAGSLVFGGGHVVLPLLEREFVPTGWLTEEQFLAGYGAAQAVPGPLFTFASYIGAVMNGWLGGIIATVAIFTPAFLLVFGALPFWDQLRRNEKVKGALMGVNAAVVGILLAALYDPIFTSAITTSVDFSFAVLLFGMLVFWKLPPWVVVLTGAIGGSLLAIFI